MLAVNVGTRPLTHDASCSADASLTGSMSILKRLPVAYHGPVIQTVGAPRATVSHDRVAAVDGRTVLVLTGHRSQRAHTVRTLIERHAL